MDTTRQHPDHPDMMKSVSDMEAIPTHPITVEEFDRMAEAGVFGDLRIELIDGQLIDVPRQGPLHAGTVSFCSDRFRDAFGARVIVRAQLPLRVGSRSQPEPDLALVHHAQRFYRDRHPAADETFAVVEVSHTTITFDRDVKRQVYAAERVPEYWIVNIEDDAVEMYRDPHDLGYGWSEVRRRGDTVSFAAFPDVVFSVDELLG